MDSVVQQPQAEPELNLLTQWGDPDEPNRRRRAALYTVLGHIAAIAILFSLPRNFFEPPPRQPEPIRHITPIFEPLTKLTQKAPNPAKSVKEFTANEPPSHPRTPAPAPAPPAPKPEPVRQAAIPPPPPPKPQQALPEPPKADAAVKAPKVDMPQLGTIPPPKIQAQENPRLPLENLGQNAPVVPPDKRVIPLPDASPSAAIRNLTGGSPQLPGLNTPQEAEPSALQLPQLLSDAQGVDFTPYLRLILQTVKRNWQTVMPESVHLGQRGTTRVVFSIGRNGQIIKMVIYESSGIESYDRAAVTGVSMSNPFPLLPSAFKGDHIAVQFNFAYNTPKK